MRHEVERLVENSLGEKAPNTSLLTVQRQGNAKVSAVPGYRRNRVLISGWGLVNLFSRCGDNMVVIEASGLDTSLTPITHQP
jgi:hypothetical protein